VRSESQDTHVTGQLLALPSQSKAQFAGGGGLT